MKRVKFYAGKVPFVFVMLLLVGSLAQGQNQNVMSAAQAKRGIKTPSNVGSDLNVSVTAGGGGSTTGLLGVGSLSGGLPNFQVSGNQNSTDCVRVGASETTVAGSGDLLVAGFNDARGFAGPPFFRGPCQTLQAGLSGFAVSTNGGQSWRDGGAPPIGSEIAFGPGAQNCSQTGRYVTRGDPWLDASGTTFVYANLAQWEDNPEAAPCDATAGVSLHFGTFLGQAGGTGTVPSFAWRRAILLQSPNYPRDFLDKESLAVDPSSRGTNLYVAVTNFIETCNVTGNGWGQIELYRSHNGGAAWHRTILERDETFITDPANIACGADGVVNQGPAVAVGTSGEVFVAYERGWLAPVIGGDALPRATIALRASTNQGASFGPRRTIASICSNAFNGPAGYNRTENNDFPRIAVASNGQYSGRIFVTFQDCSPSRGSAPFGQDTDIFLAFSDDLGQTWTTVPVHATADGKIQLWPNVSVNDRGEVTVVYHESREVTPDPNNPTAIVCSVRVGGPLSDPILKKSTVISLVDVMLARSTDGGLTFGAPVRVTSQTTNWCTATPLNSVIPNFGDYFTSRAAGSRTLITWADGRNGGRVDHIPTVFFAPGR
jgi:hypothetical protein